MNVVLVKDGDGGGGKKDEDQFPSQNDYNERLTTKPVNAKRHSQWLRSGYYVHAGRSPAGFTNRNVKTMGICLSGPRERLP
jgi:hypothetical protein